MYTPIRSRNILGAMIAAVGWAVCGASYADSIIGGPSAGFQSWTAADLNNNMAPYWDYPTNYAFPPFTNGNAGFCLTTGCAGQLSPGPAPGAIPFWGLSYDSTTDAGGGLDPNFFFQRSAPETLTATLEVSLATNPAELNSFGWFETDSAGDIVGTLHQLFSATDSLGTVATFSPTQFYGYYFVDVSEGGCLVSTLSSLNTPPCGVGFQHDMAAFATNPSSPLTSFWVAGLDDVTECQFADCNLTMVEVVHSPVPEPSTWVMMLVGFTGLGFVGRRVWSKTSALLA